MWLSSVRASQSPQGVGLANWSCFVPPTIRAVSAAAAAISECVVTQVNLPRADSHALEQTRRGGSIGWSGGGFRGFWGFWVFRGFWGQGYAARRAAARAGGPKQDQFASPTPCGDWDARTLLNHIILWTAYSAEQRAYGGSVAEELMNKDFAANPDFAEDYKAQLDSALTAWEDPEAWKRDLGVMGSPTPASDIAAMLVAEMVLHGWDLAKATGQDYRCVDAVAADQLETVEAQGEMFRQYKGFADIVDVPADASAFHRALGLSGRDPAWAPA
jgi:uncharacterized protein (TIGR03086 family)